MSLINEALKKAQRLRNEDAVDPSAPATGSNSPIPRRGKAHSANTMVLIGSGAVVLVVLSVVATVYLLNRPADTPIRAAPAPTPAVSAKSSDNAEPPAPALIAPAITPPVTIPAPEPSIAPLISEPTPGAAASVAVGSASSNAASPALPAANAASTPSSAPSVAALPDGRVAAFIEAIRVTGIRSSGTESRVLMNERVYRVNEVVERTLGIRLINVASGTLTFADANGVTYEKHF